MRGGSAKRRSRRLRPLALAALATATACAPAPPQHLVLVTLDTLRADRTSAYGFARDTTPTLAALARRGIRFDDAVAQAIVTPPSHASILTGKTPPRHGLRRLAGEALPPEQTTLAEVLHAAGFATAAFVSAVPLAANRGLDQGFDHYDVAPGIERRGRATNRRVAAWLADRPEGRLFLWVHYFDPHLPYEPPPAYQQAFLGRLATDADRAPATNVNPETTQRPDARAPEPRRVAAMRALYDAEARYTDDALAQLFGALERAGVLADAVVAVVADHGESLGEHGLFFGHWDVRFETARVPMLLAHPDGRFAGRTVAELVRTVDLMPTVLDWLGVAAPPDLDGVDLAPLLAGAAAGPESAITEQSEHVPVRALRTRDWLLVRRDPPERDPVFRLYRRSAEGESEEDVAAAHPDVRARLADALERRYDVADPARIVPIPVPEETRRKLRALGYLREEGGPTE